MIRNLKALGLALIAVFAMSAVAASAASAAQFHSTAESTTLTAGQTTQHVFNVNTGSVICETAKFSGSVTGSTVETVSVAPTYEGCEFEELFGVTVNTNECDYVFHASSATEGTVDVATCGTNKYIQVGSLATCRVRVPEQSGVGVVKYANEAEGDVLVTAEVSGLEYTESGLFCANSGGTNGTYNGTSLVNGGAAEVWVE